MTFIPMPAPSWLWEDPHVQMSHLLTSQKRKQIGWGQLCESYYMRKATAVSESLSRLLLIFHWPECVLWPPWVARVWKAPPKSQSSVSKRGQYLLSWSNFKKVDRIYGWRPDNERLEVFHDVRFYVEGTGKPLKNFHAGSDAIWFVF